MANGSRSIVSNNYLKENEMFKLFKSDPLKKLRHAYHEKLEAAMLAQRNGDIESYSMISVEAEDLLKEIQALENTAAGAK